MLNQKENRSLSQGSTILYGKKGGPQQSSIRLFQGHTTRDVFSTDTEYETT